MSELLDVVIKAHGGLRIWDATRELEVRATISGGLWERKGHPTALRDVRITAQTHSQHVEYSPFGMADRRSVFTPDRVQITNDNGDILAQRISPRASFNGHELTTPWDELQLAYFSGYAMWNYLATPFIFVLPGFVCVEGAPWSERGERWRTLGVTFPAYVATHARFQTFYFGPDGLLRRLDYTAEVTGGAATAHYTSNFESVSGLMYPTKRRAYTLGADNLPSSDRPVVAIDFLEMVARA